MFSRSESNRHDHKQSEISRQVETNCRPKRRNQEPRPGSEETSAGSNGFDFAQPTKKTSISTNGRVSPAGLRRFERRIPATELASLSNFSQFDIFRFQSRAKWNLSTRFPVDSPTLCSTRLWIPSGRYEVETLVVEREKNFSLRLGGASPTRPTAITRPTRSVSTRSNVVSTYPPVWISSTSLEIVTDICTCRCRSTRKSSTRF